jgi:hypothetical protein
MLPHIDNTQKGLYAGLIYLNENNNSFGGTGFYKQTNNMNKIRINSNDKEKFKKCLRKDRLKILGEKREFLSDNRGSFELVKMIPMKKNRAIIYSGNLIHNIYLKNIHDFNSSGRQTLNIFFGGTRRLSCITNIKLLDDTQKKNIWLSDSSDDDINIENIECSAGTYKT